MGGFTTVVVGLMADGFGDGGALAEPDTQGASSF